MIPLMKLDLKKLKIIDLMGGDKYLSNVLLG